MIQGGYGQPTDNPRKNYGGTTGELFRAILRFAGHLMGEPRRIRLGDHTIYELIFAVCGKTPKEHFIFLLNAFFFSYSNTNDPSPLNQKCVLGFSGSKPKAGFQKSPVMENNIPSLTKTFSFFFGKWNMNLNEASIHIPFFFFLISSFFFFPFLTHPTL